MLLLLLYYAAVDSPLHCASASRWQFSSKKFLLSGFRNYSASVEVRSIVINPSVCAAACLSVCMSVCPQAYLWNRWTNFHEILCADPFGRASVLPRGVALRCVLPVLWMTSRLAVMGATPAGVGSTQRRRSITCATVAESDVYECLFLVCDLCLL